jgi:ankyrin repeat protein
VAVLLDAGANPNALDKQASSPYSDALSRGKADVVAMLEKRGGKITAEQRMKQLELAAATVKERLERERVEGIMNRPR